MTTPAKEARFTLRSCKIWTALRSCCRDQQGEASSLNGVVVDSTDTETLLEATRAPITPYPARITVSRVGINLIKALISGLSVHTAMPVMWMKAGVVLAKTKVKQSAGNEPTASISGLDSFLVYFNLVCAFSMFLWVLTSRISNELRPAELTARLLGQWPEKKQDEPVPKICCGLIKYEPETRSEKMLREKGFHRHVSFVKFSCGAAYFALAQDMARSLWGGLSDANRYFQTGLLRGWEAMIAPVLIIVFLLIPSALAMVTYRLSRSAVAGNTATLILFAKDELRDDEGKDLRGRWPRLKLWLIFIAVVGYAFTNFVTLKYGFGELVVASDHMLDRPDTATLEVEEGLNVTAITVMLMTVVMSAGNSAAVLRADAQIKKLKTLYHLFPGKITAAALFSVFAFSGQYGLTYLGIMSFFDYFKIGDIVRFGSAALNSWFVQLPLATLTTLIVLGKSAPGQVFDLGNAAKSDNLCVEAAQKLSELTAKARANGLSKSTSAAVLDKLLAPLSGPIRYKIEPITSKLRFTATEQTDATNLEAFFRQAVSSPEEVGDRKETSELVLKGTSLTVSKRMSLLFLEKLEHDAQPSGASASRIVEVT
jgi:hypothetical protein